MMTQGPTPRTALARLRDWFLTDALPLWAAQGYDHARGGFHEALNFDGTPAAGRSRRVRSQARQIHAFSQSGLRGWHDGAEALAAKGFDYFLARACPDEGARGCAHRLDSEGAVIDERRDLYDQAFLLLASASRWEAAKDERALHLADRTIAFLESELASAHGGWLESDRAELPRRQNPHMHLIEAFLALHRVTGDEKYLALADRIRDLFDRVFYQTEKGVIREFFDEDWRLQDKDQPAEPGHMLEWVWLLRAHDRAHDRAHAKPAAGDSSGVRERLYERAVALGADPGFFGFFDNKAPLTGGVHSAKRLWPQTEGVRAALVLGREREAAALVDNLFMTYLATETPGLWVDEFDAEGCPVSKDTPASILYHIYEAVAEADAVLTMGEAG